MSATETVRVFGDGAFKPSVFIGLKSGKRCGVLPSRRIPGGKRDRLMELVGMCNEGTTTIAELEAVLIEGIAILSPDTSGEKLRDQYGVDDLLEIFAYAVGAYSRPAAPEVAGDESDPTGQAAATEASTRSNGTE